MHVVPVEAVDGKFFLRQQGEPVQLLGIDGGKLPVRSGWTPVRVLTGLNEVSIMQLRHERGGLGEWFLDRELRYYGNTLHDLPEAWQRTITDALPTYPEIPWDEIAAGNDAARNTVSAPEIGSIALSGIKVFNPVAPDVLAYYAHFWHRNEYLVMRNALTSEVMRLLEETVTFEKLRSNADPSQFYRTHNDEECNSFLRNFLILSRDYYEAVLATDLLPTYGFAMKYLRNSDMQPHYDNFDNPVSSTVCYHFSPEGAHNPLFLDKARFTNPFTFRVTVKDREGIPRANVVRIDLQPGDIAIFRGRHHLHWRERITVDMDYRALLLHFSDVKYRNHLRVARPTPHVPHSRLDLDNYDEFREQFALYFEPDGRDWV
jgi:hypothetical protein